jgi:CPA1 family monovalent cation:H+ antiporter
MEFAGRNELILLAVLAAITALVALAPILRVPYPILLVLGGLVLGFIPGIPEVKLPPEVVLFGVLPPLLYAAAFFTGVRDLRTKIKPISLLALGLVFATTVGVAMVAHAVTSLGWTESFVLGAIVSPTDPLAATTIARRLGIPRRIVTVVEGESLVNDASALVLYATAVTAVVSGSFSIFDAGFEFVVSIVGGVAVGLVVGWLVALVRIRLDNIPAEVTIALLTGYLAYIPATALHVSGVLAAVTVGVYMGWRAPELSTPQMRMEGRAVFTNLVFVLNALLFTLVGLQLRPILDGLRGQGAWSLIAEAAAVTAAVILVRIVWVFLTLRGPLNHRAVVAWMGMRGAVSLAAALALPLSTDAGAPFPGRELIIFLAFAVILGTLVLQGLTLPELIGRLGLEDDGLELKEDTKARVLAADAAIHRLEELVDEDWVREDTAERMRGLYNFRRTRFAARFDGSDDGSIEQRSMDYQRLRRELLEAERAEILSLRRQGRISDDVMHAIERDLDLEDQRLDV